MKPGTEPFIHTFRLVHFHLTHIQQDVFERIHPRRKQQLINKLHFSSVCATVQFTDQRNIIYQRIDYNQFT